VSKSNEDRRRAIEAETNRGVVLALHRSEFHAAGERRAEALRVADSEIDWIARLMPEALQAGFSMSELARLTGLSR
jgi:transcriptional regulator GlxA family with amidase domain